MLSRKVKESARPEIPIIFKKWIWELHFINRKWYGILSITPDVFCSYLEVKLLVLGKL